MSEFYYPLECGWDIVHGAMALVSNTPPQAGRVLRTTRVLYRYSAFVGGSMHPHAHDTVKTLAGKRYIMRPRYGPIPANSIIRYYFWQNYGCHAPMSYHYWLMHRVRRQNDRALTQIAHGLV